MYLESAVYRLVAEPANPNCVANCVRPLNVPRSLTAIASLRESFHHPPAPPSISRRWRASIVVFNRSEAARQDRVDSICLAECPVRPLLKSGCTEGIVERALALSNG